MKAIFEAMHEANEIFSNSRRYGTTVGLEFTNYRGHGINTKSMVITLNTFSFNDIKLFLDKEFRMGGEIKFYRAYDLTNEEWYIENDSFSLLNIWGKTIKKMKELNLSENGKYVVLHENEAVEIELYNNNPWNKDSFLNISNDQLKVLKSLKYVGKAKELSIHFIPKFHMWKEICYETYPDDPGCGIYSTYISVFDKATGVEFN